MAERYADGRIRDRREDEEGLGRLHERATERVSVARSVSAVHEQRLMHRLGPRLVAHGVEAVQRDDASAAGAVKGSSLSPSRSRLRSSERGDIDEGAVEDDRTRGD